MCFAKPAESSRMPFTFTTQSFCTVNCDDEKLPFGARRGKIDQEEIKEVEINTAKGM
jgi:hypothetical protein